MDGQQDAAGVTPSERFLFAECQRSFLQLWSYANVFRDQGKRGAGDGKELCDILVVFGDNVIIFSDKSCVFPSTGSIEVNWGRWYRRCIEATHKQLQGAERWIREFPDRIFLDRACTKKLPVTLPPKDRMRVFKIGVALGAGERCKGDDGGSGSLILLRRVKAKYGEDKAPSPYPPPFSVNLIEEDGQIFHVFDDATLPIILKELDTISDLVEYLETKERMIREDRLLLVGGEQELLGLFLGARAELPDVLPGAGEGPWALHGNTYEDLLKRQDYKQYVEKNKISYFWDYILAHNAACVLDGTLYPTSMKTFSENEVILRVLASENRVRRRVYSQVYLDLAKNASRTQISSRVAHLEGGETMYVFQINPQMGRSEEPYRRSRLAFLKEYVMLTAWRYQSIKRFLGICIDGADPLNDGHDVFGMEIKEWTDEMKAAGAALERENNKSAVMPPTPREFQVTHMRAWGRTPKNRKRQKDRRKQKRRKRR